MLDAHKKPNPRFGCIAIVLNRRCGATRSRGAALAQAWNDLRAWLATIGASEIDASGTTDQAVTIALQALGPEALLSSSRDDNGVLRREELGDTAADDLATVRVQVATVEDAPALSTQNRRARTAAPCRSPARPEPAAAHRQIDRGA